MSNDYTLTLRTSPVDLSSKTDTPEVVMHISDLEGVKDSWSRNITWLGGCDLGEFQVYGNADELSKYFTSWLGLDIIEDDMGIITWNGQIVEIELHTGVLPKRRSLTRMHNRVKAHVDAQPDQYPFIPWQNHLQSQAIYGVREQIIEPGCYAYAQTIDEAQYHLRRYGWPPLETVATTRNPNDRSYLKVRCMGYKWTVNNRYVEFTGLSGLLKDRSKAIEDVLDDSQYVTPVSLDANTADIEEDVDNEKGWDFIEKLLQLSDDSYNIYHGWVDMDRQFYYKTVDTSNIDYYIVNGKVRAESSATAQELRPRHVRPGIFRDMDFPLWGAEDSHWLADRADILVVDVAVGPDGLIQYLPADASVAEFLRYYRSIKMDRPSGSLPGDCAPWDLECIEEQINKKKEEMARLKSEAFGGR